MTYKSVPGGFELAADDKELITKQRAITARVNSQLIQVGAVFLKMSGKNPIDDDWADRNHMDTNLQDWIDNPEYELHNVGFNLQLGWMDIDIDADDPVFNECMVAALDFNGVDTRFRFGRRSVGYPTHVLVQLNEEEAKNFDVLSRFEPKEFRINGKRYHTQLRSYPTNIVEKKNADKQAKQTVMPGSVYLHKKNEGEYDVSVWYNKDGAIADNVRQIAQTTPRRTSFNQVVRAIAFASLLYVVKDYWIEGQRQLTATKVAGWLARIVKDGQAMNNHEVISADVFCPVDTDEIAEGLIQFICNFVGDDEAAMRIRTYRDAVGKLDRNPDAKIPGWPAMEALFGPAHVMALRATFTPGSDVSILTKLAERYAYDETDGLYIDRDRHGDNFEVYSHEPAQLERRHIDDVVLIAGKPRKAFGVFETSKMRTKVGARNLYPDMGPGAIFRVNRQGEVLNDDDEDRGISVFNTWRGWPILPVESVNPEIMEKCIAHLDKLLGYLTSDNPNQIHWAKQWFAWTMQNPGIKQQIAWVVVGGQGVGKSFFGNTFAQALLGTLWGTASASIIDSKFNIGPFVDKMFVFVDEVKFHNESGTDEVKKLIRNVDTPGQLKYGEGQNFKIYARMMFASNTFDMAIGQKSVIDRALFYTKAYSGSYMGLTDPKFREWTETLKPWFSEFNDFLQSMEVKRHYVHYFMNLPVTKSEVESIKYSSSQDDEITSANMRPSRRIAKYILEDCSIIDGCSIEAPFTMAALGEKIEQVANVMHIRPVRTDLVLAEFKEAGLLRTGMGAHTFAYKCETLIDLFSEAISVKLEKRWDFDEDDRGENDDPKKRKASKSAKRTGVVQEYKF